MKNILKLFLILPFCLALAGCSDDDDGTKLVLSESQIHIHDWNETATVDILKGNGGYSVSVIDNTIATAEIVNEKRQIRSVKTGTTLVIVKDKKNKSVYIEVTVGDGDTTPATIIAYLTVGETETHKIFFSENDSYFTSNSDATVATADVSLGILTINALKRGQTTIWVTSKADDRKEVQVYVYDADELIILPESNVNAKVNSNTILSILKGDGNYTAVPANPSIATATILTDSKITVRGLTAGSTTITVSDGSGKSAIIDVEITN